MKRPLHFLFTILLLASSITGANAQIFFTEDFEGAVGANGLPTGFTETGLSTDGIWSTGDATAASSAYITVPAAIQGTNFAYTNDDACDCDKSADRLILPAQDLSAMAGARVIFDVFLPGDYGGTGYVEVSTDNGATWTTANTITAGAAWQDNLMVDISAYTGGGNTNVLVSFLYNDGGAWADVMAIDDIKLEELTSTSPDMELTAASGSEYTIVPFTQITPINLSADVTNTGSANATDASLTVNVYDATDLVNPLQTTTSTATAVNAAATANLTAGTFTPTALATYVFEFITTATGDANAMNDTTYTSLLVNQNIYARDDANVTGSFGIGAGPTGYMGYMFTMVATAPVDSVFGAFNKAGTSNTPGDGVGDSTRFVIYDVASGLPNAVIGESEVYVFTPADTSGLTTHTLEMQASGGGTLSLAPGTYFVAAAEYNTNVGVAYADNNFQNNTFYASWTGQPWTTLETFGAGFSKAPVIRPILGCGLTATTSTTNATCTASDGTATATADGVGPYTYLWSDGQTTATASNLAAGTYDVTVTDDLGCEVIETVTVNSNSTAITATSSTTDASCGSADGTATATPTNGTAPYTYVWSDGQTTATATNLAAGSYDVTVTDANGCTGVISGIEVINPGAPTASTTVTSDVSCNGSTDGEVMASATGGTAPYAYVWSDGQTTATASNLSAGTYEVTIIDAASCSSVSSVTITEPSAIAITETTTNVSVAGGSDGAIDLTVTGGTPPYNYVWSNGETTEDISGLTAGTYTCTITDANGCTDVVTVTVLDGTVSLANNISGIGSVKLFPNPADAQVTLSFDLKETSNINVEVVNSNGQVLKNINDVDVLNTNYVLDVSSWSNGVYFVKVQTTEGAGVIRFVKQ